MDSETTAELVTGTTTTDVELKPDEWVPTVEEVPEVKTGGTADSVEVITMTVVADSVPELDVVVSATETVELLTLGVAEEELGATVEESVS